jgi:hypothetical protein
MRSTRVALAVLVAPLFLGQCNCDPMDGIDNAPGGIKGRACDIRTGEGATGVEVAVNLEAGGSRRATSESGGRFQMENLPPGLYKVTFTQNNLSTRGAERFLESVEVKTDALTEVLDPACIAGRQPPGTGWVRGRVCNRHTGGWVSQAAVTIQLESGGLAQTVTDEEGNFLLEAVPEGAHTLYVRSSNFQRAYAIIVVTGQETLLPSPTECRGVDPTSGGVQGIMCAPNGTGPLTGATAYIDVGDPSVRIQDMTDAQGRFILTGIPPGDYDLRVKLGSWERTYRVTIRANELTEVGPMVCNAPDPTTTGTVEGYFCDPNGGWLLNGRVLMDLPNTTLEDSTDALGRFSFAGVPPGNWLVKVQHPAYTQDFSVTVAAGQTTRVAPQQICESGHNPGPKGTIEGRLCAPNGTTWLANARVWVTVPGGGTVETMTDSEGRFTLSNVPVGTYTVHVQAGSFTTDFPGVVVRENEITAVGDSPDTCVPLQDTHKIAVVSGKYDDIEIVLRRLGLTRIDSYVGWVGDDYTPDDGSYHTNLLDDFSLMQTYDVIFFNCGMFDKFLDVGANRDIAIQNLRAYVAGGRSVYFSDWAYDLVEKAWPEYVDFYGDDGRMDTAQVALGAENQPARVVDPALWNAVGTQDVAINFNLSLWAPVIATGLQTKTYIRGNAIACTSIDWVLMQCMATQPLNNIPYTVGFHPGDGAGKVIYTAFHQERQTTRDMDIILELLVFEL